MIQKKGSQVSTFIIAVHNSSTHTYLLLTIMEKLGCFDGGEISKK